MKSRMPKYNPSALTAIALIITSVLSCRPVQAQPAHSATSTGVRTDTLTVQRIAQEPVTDQLSATLRWSADSARVAWMQLLRPLPGDPANPKKARIQQEIWSIDVAAHPSSAPSLLLSASKITDVIRSSGPAIHQRPDDESNPYMLQDFAWSRDHNSLFLIGLRSLTWLNWSSGEVRTLLTGDSLLSDVSLSPDGQNVVFLRNHQMWIADTLGKSVNPIGPPAREGFYIGEPDWPYRNEFHLSRGYWWSPDSTAIAYLETDDRQVAKYPIRSSDGNEREIVYPTPGGNLPIVQVSIKRVVAGTRSNPSPVEIKLGQTKNMYIPRVQWLPDGNHLAIERLDRRQQTLELLIADAVTGQVKPVLTESDKYWINLTDDLRFLSDSRRFIWSSERDGYRHLYLYDVEGKELQQLTHGNWEVTQLDAIDEPHNLLYLTATEKSPLERQLYAVKLDDSSSVTITSTPGTHTAFFAPNQTSLLDVYSNHARPPDPHFLDLGKPASSTRVPKAADSSFFAGTTPASAPEKYPRHSKDPQAATSNHPADLQPVEYLDLKLHQGVTVHSFIIKPANFDPKRKYPVIVYLASGPGEQLVRDQWRGPEGLWMQLMAQKGYILFGMDNQGTAGRGHYFEEPIHLRLGGIELADQRDGLQYLSTLPYVDFDRLGVCGWGYGGFLAIHAMLDRPLSFKAGFAGAAVTDWHYYDAIFAERYLDDSVLHADGWDASSAVENARFLKGSLMLGQGTEDEFVHIENLLTLQDKLLDAGKAADVLLFPDRGHQIDDPPARLVLFTRLTDFFLKNL